VVALHRGSASPNLEFRDWEFNYTLRRHDAYIGDELVGLLLYEPKNVRSPNELNPARVVVVDVATNPKYLRQGIATAIALHVRAMYPGVPWQTGTGTAAGQPWMDSLPFDVEVTGDRGDTRYETFTQLMGNPWTSSAAETPINRDTTMKTWQQSNPAKCVCCSVRLSGYRAYLPPVCDRCYSFRVAAWEPYDDPHGDFRTEVDLESLNTVEDPYAVTVGRVDPEECGQSDCYFWVVEERDSHDQVVKTIAEGNTTDLASAKEAAEAAYAKQSEKLAVRGARRAASENFYAHWEDNNQQGAEFEAVAYDFDADQLTMTTLEDALALGEGLKERAEEGNVAPDSDEDAEADGFAQGAETTRAEIEAAFAEWNR
jgi:hypothetical protein